MTSSLVRSVRDTGAVNILVKTLHSSDGAAACILGCYLASMCAVAVALHAYRVRCKFW